MSHPLAQLMPYLVPVIVILLVVRRNLRPRRLKVERLWIMPVVIFGVSVLSLASRPPGGAIVLIGLFIVLCLGGVMGWFRGRLTTIAVDPQTHDLTSKASPLGIVLVAGLFVVRYALRIYLAQHADAAAGPLGANAAALTDALLLFSVGLLTAQRIEMWLRARRLLKQAIAMIGRPS